MTCAAPVLLRKLILPPTPILTVTRFGIVSPLAKFTEELFGSAAPDGHTRRYEPAVPPVAVTLATIAVAVGGTTPPVTTRSRGAPLASGVLDQPPTSVRESSTRLGLTPVKRSPVVVPSSKYPTTS